MQITRDQLRLWREDEVTKAFFGSLSLEVEECVARWVHSEDPNDKENNINRGRAKAFIDILDQSDDNDLFSFAVEEEQDA